MLADVRKKKGLSQGQLAKLSGVSVRTIQNYEIGHRNIDLAEAQIVHRLAQALECEPGELLNVFTEEGLELSNTERSSIIKREQAEEYSGFKQYPSTCRAIFNFIPAEMFERLPAKELGEIAKVINAAYQAGKKERALD